MDDTPKDQAQSVASAILRPLSKLLIRYDISLAAAVEALKRALVQSAIESGAKTDSLISLRTGVHRKDVKRLRAEDTAPQNTPRVSSLALVLSTWAEDPAFGGQPLARTGPTGFDALVKASKIDLAPATVLRELLALGLVAEQGDDRLALLTTTVVPEDGAAALEAFRATTTDHLRIAIENMMAAPGTPRQFDRVLRYTHLSDASVAALDAAARKGAEAYLADLNTLAHRLQNADDAKPQTFKGRFVSGAFIAPTLNDSDDSPEKDAEQ